MHFTTTVYKHSALATICSALGMVFLITGLYCLLSVSIITGLVFLALGGLLLFLSPKINKRAVMKKLKKSLTDPELIRQIQQSAVAAYSLFLNAPSIFMLEFLDQHNPEAAKLIAAKQAGHMTEDELIQQLRSLDGTAGQQTSDDSSRTSPNYTNDMFSLETVQTLSELTVKQQAALTKQKKSSKLLLTICAPLLFIGLATMIVCFQASTTTTEYREETYFMSASTGDYTCIEAREVLPYRTDDSYVYCRADGILGDVYFRISLDEEERFNAIYPPNSSSDWRYNGQYVPIYGVVRNIDGVAILDGSFEPELRTVLNAPQPWTVLSVILSVISGICVIIFGVKYLSAKKGLKALAETSHIQD